MTKIRTGKRHYDLLTAPWRQVMGPLHHHEQYLADKASAACAPTCSLCRRECTLDDAYDYHPIQAITGKPLGWYSGDDGEVCPECMTKTLRGGV